MSDIDLDDAEWADIAAALDIDAEDAVTRSKALPAPPVGSDGGKWRLASGAALQGEVTRVDGRVVHARHASTCGRCGGRGGSRGWPGFTCFRCNGRTVESREVRLYAPHQVRALADAKVRRREEAARASAEARAWRDAAVEEGLRDVMERHAPLFERVAALRARERDPFVDEVMGTVLRVGSISDRQVAAVEGACGRLVDLDEQRRLSRPVGNPGDRLDLVLTCQSIHRIEVDGFGIMWLNGVARQRRESIWMVTYRDRKGATFLHKAKTPPPVKAGDALQARGKVKCHQEHRGVMQTVLNYFRVVAVLHVADDQEALREMVGDVALDGG